MSGHDLRAGVAAAAATFLGSFALVPVYASAAWVAPVLAVIVVVLAGGLLMRVGGPALWNRLRPGQPVPDRLSALGVALVPAGQLFLVLCLLTARYAPAEAILGVIPTPGSLGQLGTVLAEGTAELQEQSTPALPLTGLLVLTALFVAPIAVLVDLVTVAGRQATLAGLGLLVLYCIPVSTVTGAIGVTAVAAPAAGLALLLWTDQHRALAASGRPPGSLLGTGTVAAVRIGAVAVVSALVVGSVVPTLTEGSLSTGLGGGSGGSTGTSLDPVATMHGQLTLPEPMDLLRVQSSVDDPGFLRAVALDQYDNEGGWTMSNLDGEVSVAEDPELAPLPSGQSRREVTVSVEVLEHNDRFLPVPFSPIRVRMADDSDEDWRFDPASGTVFGRDTTSEGRRYSVTATEPRPSTALLAAAEPLAPGNPIQERYTALPPLDPRVTDDVVQVLGNAETPYQRVSAILAFLTDRSNDFLYSLSTKQGTSGDDLVDFLRLRRGYCEQYAGAMAVMVRAAGVPARLVLGYTPGQEQGDGSRLITSDDAHAWVEVYYSGLGWVTYDPTPLGPTRTVDLPWAPHVGSPTAPDSGQGAPAPTAPSVPQAPREDRAGDFIPAGQLGTTDRTPWQLYAGAGLVVQAALLAALPAGIRGLQRRRRVAAGTPAALWDELTATATDVGSRLHPAWTPRQAARELAIVVRAPGAPVGSAEAVERLARAEEVASYGPSSDAPVSPELAEELTAALRTARQGLLRSIGRRGRLQAVLWPASLVTGAGGRAAARLRRLGSTLRPRRVRAA